MLLRIHHPHSLAIHLKYQEVLPHHILPYLCYKMVHLTQMCEVHSCSHASHMHLTVQARTRI